jgi:hypothetical protein
MFTKVKDKPPGKKESKLSRLNYCWISKLIKTSTYVRFSLVWKYEGFVVPVHQILLQLGP